MSRYDAFFSTATNGRQPYGYQCRLACGDQNGRSEGDWLAGGAVSRSQLINIPTGLGKTAAVVLAWLWNRVQPENPNWPRRLVYCLPMRTLVEQTENEVRKWLEAHGLLWDDRPETRHGKIGVHILMGGEGVGEWDVYPEESAILIGTQDMLLSRALNRGYGMNRYRWPMHFGLLNNDALWVMDETQLMGVSVETSAQLDGFRHDEKRPVFGTCPTWWMSATLDAARLATVDHPKPDGGWSCERLTDKEKTQPGKPKELFGAKKSVNPCKLSLTPATKNDYAKRLVEDVIIPKHKSGTLTLVIVNRVKRAQEIYEALTKPDKKAKHPFPDPARVALVHSRFRRADREKHEKLLFGNGDRIVIATQAVEAGVDVSAQLLITELAPWSSLVQRFGRCNRRAEHSDAKILWVDIEPDAKGELLLPYAEDDLRKAREAIKNLSDASPATVQGIKVAITPVVRPVIRRRDLVDLFDTTPDICGQVLDISRYIRDEQDNDVQFFWRAVGEVGSTPDEKPPRRDELCRVSIGDATKFLGKKPRAWRWNPLDEKWEAATSARPGSVYLVDVKSGGYREATGWTGEAGDKPTPLPPSDEENERYSGDHRSFDRQWQTLAEHTAQVVAEARRLASALGLTDTEIAPFITAAQWHDIGKAHAEFQKLLQVGGPPPRSGQLWAKSANKDGKCARRGFRHELASALAWLLAGPTNAPDRDLVAYLIAAHHGKVRLSIRSLPEEQGNPQNHEALFARGLWQGDKLPTVPLGDLTVPETTLDLSFMRMGEGPHGPSWLARAVALRDRLGPFRLAYLETLLRAADARASAVAPSQTKR